MHFLPHPGKGYYIYIEASQPANEKHSAKLLSPFIWGPKCFRFYYHMYGSHIGKLGVLLQIRGPYGNYLMWQKSGQQGNQWREANIDIGYASEFQVSIPELTTLLKNSIMRSTFLKLIRASAPATITSYSSLPNLLRFLFVYIDHVTRYCLSEEKTLQKNFFCKQAGL